MCISKEKLIFLFLNRHCIIDVQLWIKLLFISILTSLPGKLDYTVGGCMRCFSGVVRLTPMEVACVYKQWNCSLCGSCCSIPALESVEQLARCGCNGVTTSDLRFGTGVLKSQTLHKGGFAVFMTTDIQIGTTGCNRSWESLTTTGCRGRSHWGDSFPPGWEVSNFCTSFRAFEGQAFVLNEG